MAIRSQGAWTFVRSVISRTSGDSLMTWASATAYAWLFAIFPFFLMLMSLLPYLPANWKSSARTYTHEAIYQLPHEAADTVWSNIEPKLDQLLNRPPRGLFSIGLIITIWSASGGLVAIMYALDRCYDVKKARSFFRQRLTAVGLTMIVLVMILLVIILVPIGTLLTALAQWWVSRHPTIQYFLPILIVWQILRYAVSLLLMFGVVAILYRYGPNIRPRRQTIVPGAVFCVGVWVLLGLFFRVYVDRFGKYNETYGTVGGVAVLLILFYIDALVLLIGAEINHQVDCALPKELDTTSPVPEILPPPDATSSE